MRITHYRHNPFVVEEGAQRSRSTPGQNFYIFDFRSRMPEGEGPTVAHFVITHSDSEE